MVEQEKCSDVDVWTGIIVPLLKTRTQIEQREIFKDALGIPTKDIDRRQADRVGRIMMKLGWQRLRDRTNGDDRTIYRRPDEATRETKDGMEVMDW